MQVNKKAQPHTERDIYIYTYIHMYLHLYIFEGNLEAKLPTIWTDEKQRWEESERRED